MFAYQCILVNSVVHVERGQDTRKISGTRVLCTLDSIVFNHNKDDKSPPPEQKFLHASQAVVARTFFVAAVERLGTIPGCSGKLGLILGKHIFPPNFGYQLMITDNLQHYSHLSYSPLWSLVLSPTIVASALAATFPDLQ